LCLETVTGVLTAFHAGSCRDIAKDQKIAASGSVYKGCDLLILMKKNPDQWPGFL
jgi:hypothetical protein